MALPPGAAAALGEDMASKGMGGAPDAEPDDGADGDKVYEQICGDAFDAMKSGNKEDFCRFMLELLERYNADKEAKEGPEEGEEET